MTKGERDQMAEVWRENRDAFLASFTPERTSLVGAYYPPMSWASISDAPGLSNGRVFRFDYHQGCLDNWRVWYVTCEGELVEYGV